MRRSIDRIHQQKTRRFQREKLSLVGCASYTSVSIESVILSTRLFFWSVAFANHQARSLPFLFSVCCAVAVQKDRRSHNSAMAFILFRSTSAEATSTEAS